ncbi:NADPH cytochrome P450 reductase B [Trypanosoma grayi]|uniref:NADPH cytochrome P450 reductase B n=1 Tax=Trypanosoma grayi TaxID=71804 RepID=UPI0004F40CD6|nr:NADPH cytochrome P450 reductase B [Trypanosoma grayi]KEG10924.1 NADPH cytochrome P450 reductase B [Trypanosoma grayi]
MPRGLPVAASVTVGALVVVFVMRLWRRCRAPSAASTTFASKYAAMLQQQKERTSKFTEGAARVMIIYGSTSGNAETYATGLVTNLTERGVDTVLIDPSAWAHLNQRSSQQPLFPPSTKGELPIVVCIVSTTGEGEVPANFFSFFAEMQEALEDVDEGEKKPFANVSYAVFALGDSSYKYYCRAGLNVNMIFKKGGGVELLPIVLGDARNPFRDDVFEEWEEKLMDVLEQRCGVVLGAESDVPPRPQLVFQFAPERPISELPYTPPSSLLEPSMQFPAQFLVQAKTPCTEKRRDGSFVLHLILDIEGNTVSYQAGDHLGMYPANPPDVVEAYRKALNISEKDWVTPVLLGTVANSRARASFRNTFPACVALRTVFERYLDLCGRPRKSMLRFLAKYCTDPTEKASFLELLCRGMKGNGENKTEMNGSSPNSLSIFRIPLDYLNKFPSCCCVPIGHFLEMMPRVQPRFYSIASDMLTHPTTVEVFIRIIPNGMNSQYLQKIDVGEKITAFIHKTSFHLPKKCGGRPVIMIGPGTGVASMLGFCHRRAALMKQQPSITHGSMVLFFGAQKRATEYFVRQELEMWCPHGEGKLPSPDVLPPSVLTLLDVAFSRDQAEKYYVTDLIEKHKDYLLQLLTNTTKGGCILYLSGNASHMAKSVDKALLNVLVYGGMTRSAASAFLRKMEMEHRYLKDIY